MQIIETKSGLDLYYRAILKSRFQDFMITAALYATAYVVSYAITRTIVGKE